MSGVIEDRSLYIARLWLDAGSRRREAARLQRIAEDTIAEAMRIEHLARTMTDELDRGGA